jgi:hypothetical protein
MRNSSGGHGVTSTTDGSRCRTHTHTHMPLLTPQATPPATRRTRHCTRHALDLLHVYAALVPRVLCKLHRLRPVVCAGACWCWLVAGAVARTRALPPAPQALQHQPPAAPGPPTPPPPPARLPPPPPPPPPRSWLGAAAVAGALTKFAVPLLPLSSCCSAAVTYTRSRVSEPADSLTCSQQGEARMPVHGPLVLPGAACLPSWCLQQHSTAHDTRPLRTERPLAHVYTEAVVWQDVYAPDVLQLCFDEEQERGHRCCWCALVCGGGATCVRACVRACVCPTDVRFST